MRLLLILLFGFFVSCSSDDDTNNGKTTTGTTQTSATNNQSNNNASNNTSSGTSSGTTQTAVIPDPFDFTCNDFTPAGGLDVIAGYWDIKDLCFFENPFAAFNVFCDDIVFTDFEITETEGRVIVDLPYFALVDFSEVEVDLFVPNACAEKLGGGTCEGVKDRIKSLITAEVSCTENVDACECHILGEFGTRRSGSLELVSPGFAKTLEFDENGNLREDQIQFAVDGIDLGGVFATGSNMDVLEVEVGAVPSMCEAYCTTFMASCNNASNLDPYDNGSDCLEKCTHFPSTGQAETSGDSLECRLHFARLGSDGSDLTNFETHCPKAQYLSLETCID